MTRHKNILDKLKAQGLIFDKDYDELYARAERMTNLQLKKIKDLKKKLKKVS